MKYYNYRYIDSFEAPIAVILSRRGLGKTFGAVMKGIKKFVSNRQRFVYVVETEDMIQELSQNKGEKFFANIFKYLEENPTNSNNKLLEALSGGSKKEEAEVTEGDVLNKITGGTIKIAGDTAGYIVSFNGFSKLKRNNFRDIGMIIIDEFIPETVDIRSIKNAYKIVSLVQSVARLQDVKIYMLANSIRTNDIVLQKLGISNIKTGEIRRIKDKYGLLIVAQFVDNKDYEEFVAAADASVSGRLAAILNEDNLEKNEFKDACPAELLIKEPKRSHLLFCLHGEIGSVRIHAAKDYSEYYVMEDYGENVRQRITLDQKFITPVVKYSPNWKDALINKYASNQIKFDTSISFTIFKNCLHLNVN